MPTCPPQFSTKYKHLLALLFKPSKPSLKKRSRPRKPDFEMKNCRPVLRGENGEGIWEYAQRYRISFFSSGSLFSSLEEFSLLKPHSSQPLSAYLPSSTSDISLLPSIQAYRPTLHGNSQGNVIKRGEEDETKGNGGRGGYN